MATNELNKGTNDENMAVIELSERMTYWPNLSEKSEPIIKTWPRFKQTRKHIIAYNLTKTTITLNKFFGTWPQLS